MRFIKNIFLLIIILIYTILYKLIIFPNFMKLSSIINVSFFLILLVISIKMLGFRKNKATYISTNIFKIVVFFLIVTFLVMYTLGFKTGFLKNSYSLNSLTMLDNIFAPILLIIFVELFRYVVIWANEDKKIFIILFTILITVFELAINIRTLNAESIELLFNILASKVLPITIKNIVMSYVCFYAGYKIPLLYRLVMDIYVYVFPIFPDLGDYVNAIILLVLPSSIYFFSSTIIEEKIEKIDYVYIKSNFSWTEIPFIITLIIVICLVSGIFPLYMIGIKSNSMQPNINRGDAVIILRTDKEIDQGKIVAYKYKEKIIVHRVTKVTEINGKKVYITKGDANKTDDSLALSAKQIDGVIKLRIKYIAYPAIWISELFEK